MGKSHAERRNHPQRGQWSSEIVLLLCRPMRHLQACQLDRQVHGLTLYKAIAVHTLSESATGGLQRATEPRLDCHARVAVSQAGF